ncbi:hypothetical protein PSN45_000234 [Yamadazyma tenuis]|nr:hypothetical protein PSN45_000234 [Yamadazyma tenuis]
MSCYTSTEAYSSLFLTRYQFNKKEMSIVSFNGTETTESDLSSFTLSIGYLSFCVSYDGSVSCTTFDNLGKLKTYPIISVDTGDKNTTIDLVKLARKFNNICYPYVLMSAMIMALACLALNAWISVPLLPGKLLVRKMIVGVSGIDAMVWGVGSMLQHQATKANQALVPSASMKLVQVKTGIRAEAVTWTAFSFLVVIALGNGVLLLRELRNQLKATSKLY